MSRADRDFWINQAFFQLAWPACVLGAAYGTLWPAALLIGGMLAWTLHPANRRAGDVRALSAFAFTGVLVDTLWIRTGVVDYAMQWPVEGFQPAWLTGLWIALGLTVHHSLAVFGRRWRLWVLLATVGSPLSYAMASRVGAVDWIAPDWVVVLCMGPVWAVLTGSLFRILGPGSEPLASDGSKQERRAARTASEGKNTMETVQG
ncbi:DUF2878 domain-containing protein [Halomonas denitrificans]|nr:DUF2878 domain-containing protein [Halomonas denitrificans]